MQEHFRKLENLYQTAPVQKLYQGISIVVSEGKSKITYPVDATHFHGGGSLHGAVFFKLLDDAAYFAAASIITDVFIVTASFQIKMKKPVTGGLLTAIGTLLQHSGDKLTAEAEIRDADGALVATGNGLFIKTSNPLESIADYRLSL